MGFFFATAVEKKPKIFGLLSRQTKKCSKYSHLWKTSKWLLLFFLEISLKRLTHQSIGLLWYWYLHWNCLRNLECCATIQYRVFHLFEMQPCYIPAAPRTPECNLSDFFLRHKPLEAYQYHKIHELGSLLQFITERLAQNEMNVRNMDTKYDKLIWNPLSHKICSYFTDSLVGNLLEKAYFTERSLIYNKGHKGTQREQPKMDVKDSDT